MELPGWKPGNRPKPIGNLWQRDSSGFAILAGTLGGISRRCRRVGREQSFVPNEIEFVNNLRLRIMRPMPAASSSPLAALEPRLRPLLPADLCAAVLADPTPSSLTRSVEHLRALQRSLRDYLPRQIHEAVSASGPAGCAWQEGTLMRASLKGFTFLLEVNLAQQPAGAEAMLGVLNDYCAETIGIIGQFGGYLLELTGDTLLAHFPPNTNPLQSETAQAVRAGLRMQRAMQRFANVETSYGTFPLRLRLGLHAGRFLAAGLGTPRRMEHVLLGNTVQHARDVHEAAATSRLCITEAASERVRDQFRFEPGPSGCMLAVDDFTADQLREHEITLPSGRPVDVPTLDRSVEGLAAEIEKAVGQVEPLACYLPGPILDLLVESVSKRHIPAAFCEPTVASVSLAGWPEPVDHLPPGTEAGLVSALSEIFALVNEVVEKGGGVLKKVTCHPAGSLLLIFFGAPKTNPDDPLRAAETALAIRDTLRSTPVKACQIGLARGRALAAETGRPRGRRQFNVLGDVVSIAARLRNRAAEDQILVTDAVYQAIAQRCDCEPFETDKATSTPLYSVRGRTGPL